MKFNKVARIAAASLLSFAACLGFTACSRDYTVGFLYVLSSRGSTSDPNGTISEFGIDYQTGALIPLASSGQSTQGRDPVAISISANQKNVYIVNHDDSNLEHLVIGSDGKLYPQSVTSLDGIYPTGVAVSPNCGTYSEDTCYLYVSFTYQKTSATSNSGPGGVEVYKLAKRADASGDEAGAYDVGAPVSNNGVNFFPMGLSPAAIAVGPNMVNNSNDAVNPQSCLEDTTSCSSYVYVIDQDASTNYNLLVFKRDIGTGALTAVGDTNVTNSGATGYLSGVTASSVTVAPRGTFVYVSDSASNQIVGYGVGSTGALRAMTSGPFATGSLPMHVTIDPRGSFLYVADFNDGAVSAYTINQSSGALSAVATNAKIATEGAGTNCVTVENALGIYLYAVNNYGNTVSGFELNSTTGVLKKIRNSPYNTSAAPTCAAAIANGTHATQLVQ